MTPKPEQAAAPPRVAVVIVTRNQREALRRCLSALGKSHFRVVVDSGAGDSAGVAEEFPEARLVTLPRHFGMTKALNLGIRAATEAEFVLLLSPEVEIAAAAVDELADAFAAQSGVGAVCPRLLLPDGTPAGQARDLPTAAEPDPPLRAAKAGEAVPCVGVEAVMFRMFFLRALREIDERYGEYGSAIELCQQVRRANKTILIHPTATAVWHGGVAELSSEEEADREVGTAKYLAKHHGLGSGWLHWLSRVLAALFSLRFGKLMQVASWKKIDGD